MQCVDSGFLLCLVSERLWASVADFSCYPSTPPKFIRLVWFESSSLDWGHSGIPHGYDIDRYEVKASVTLF